jgi:hypothetical protein
MSINVGAFAQGFMDVALHELEKRRKIENQKKYYTWSQTQAAANATALLDKDNYKAAIFLGSELADTPDRQEQLTKVLFNKYKQTGISLATIRNDMVEGKGQYTFSTGGKRPGAYHVKVFTGRNGTLWRNPKDPYGANQKSIQSAIRYNNFAAEHGNNPKEIKKAMIEEYGDSLGKRYYFEAVQGKAKNIDIIVNMLVNQGTVEKDLHGKMRVVGDISTPVSELISEYMQDNRTFKNADPTSTRTNTFSFPTGRGDTSFRTENKTALMEEDWKKIETLARYKQNNLQNKKLTLKSKESIMNEVLRDIPENHKQRRSQLTEQVNRIIGS